MKKKIRAALNELERSVIVAPTSMENLLNPIFKEYGLIFTVDSPFHDMECLELYVTGNSTEAMIHEIFSKFNKCNKGVVALVIIRRIVHKQNTWIVEAKGIEISYFKEEQKINFSTIKEKKESDESEEDDYDYDDI